MFSDEEINAVDERGKTALHRAVEYQDYKLAKKLLSSDADPNVFDSRGRTPLHYATMSDNLMMVEMLLDHGAYVDAEIINSTLDWTPLLIAMSFNRRDISILLLRRGAYPDKRILAYEFREKLMLIQPPTWSLNITHGKDGQISRLLVQNIVKLEASDELIDSKDYRSLLVDQYEEYYDKCWTEIKQMQCQTVHERVTLYDILVSKDVAPFVTNKRIADGFKKCCYRVNYPIYGGALRERFSREADKRAELKKSAGKGLAKFLRCDENASHLILSNVMVYLNSRDLTRLTRLSK